MLPSELVGHTVYRRRAHLVVWDSRYFVTVAPWALYWSPMHGGRTFACLSRSGFEGLWLPVVELVGHWDWYTGEVAGARILSGYGPFGCEGPLTERIYPHARMDPDTGCRYWHSDRGRLPSYAPMSHT